jgi:hypothetical protein|tara:strand:+ start:713 stop:1117 length:405 start_codon:yes stop_codon:yes gene_type:complete
MKISIYKIIKSDDTCYYTNDRRELIETINTANKDVDGFKAVNINTINGLLYNKSKQLRGIKSIERYDGQEYYKEYIDKYVEWLMEQQEYSPHTIKRFKNHFLKFINSIEISSRNNGDGDDIIRDRITAVGMIKV